MQRLFFIILLFAIETAAEPVTIAKDPEGREIYQSGEWFAGDKTELPQLEREQLTEKIERLRSTTPETCASRGGVDCALGADSADGSAICQDGHRGVALSYQEACSSARLEIARVSFFADRELSGSELRPFEYGGIVPQRILIHLRNLSGVTAYGVEVRAEVAKRRFNAAGPSQVAPFALEEYTFSPDRSQLPPFTDFRKSYRTRVSCKNCSVVRTGRY